LLRKSGDFVAATFVAPGVVDIGDVSAVDVNGCDRLKGLRNPACWCWCCFRLRCSTDDEEAPTSAVLPNEDTSPMAAKRNTSIVAAIGKYIGRPLH
jgi:hypothetical protein